MTTINNLTIEQMREIVSGAPDRTADTYVADTDTYFSAEFGSYFDHAEFDWLDSDYKSYAEIRDNYETVFWLNNLRTAISEHDEFKVGDLVVHPKFDNKKIYEIIKIKGDLFTVFYDRNSHSFRSDLRHATPSEIKAGHRIDDNTDHVTDIRNHVSPSTRVVDLASGEDWTVEAERHG